MDYTKYLKELKPFPEEIEKMLEEGIKQGFDIHYLLHKLNINISDYYIFDEKKWKAQKHRKSENFRPKIFVPVTLTPHKKYFRHSLDEKIRIIELVENSDFSKKSTLKALNVCKRTYFNWLNRYKSGNINDLRKKKHRKVELKNRDKTEYRDDKRGPENAGPPGVFNHVS